MAKKEDGSKMLGTGAAKKAADEIKKRKKRNKSRLSIIMDAARSSRKQK